MASSGQGAVPPPPPRTLPPLADSLVPAFLAQIGLRMCGGLSPPGLEGAEPEAGAVQRHTPLPWPQEAAVAGGRGQIVQEGLSKYGLWSNCLGVYFRSISHQVTLSHRHTWAQRTVLSHAGTAHPCTAHLPESGTHGHGIPTQRCSSSNTDT